MRVTRLLGFGPALAFALMAGSMTPALAQAPRSGEDMVKEAEVAARAQKDADALRAETEKAGVKPLVASIPVTPENTWVLEISDGARVRVALRPDIAPGHVERIKTLSRQGFYNGLKFHRVRAVDGSAPVQPCAATAME